MNQIRPSLPSQPPADTGRTGSRFRHFGLTLLAVMVVLAGWGIVSRYESGLRLKETTEAQSIVTVATTRPKTGPTSSALILPGTVQAFVEAPIYARANGYIKSWNTDIGAIVKKGQLLAEIDSPEVDDQLHQAEADYAMAEANEVLAKSTAKRWQALLATDSVTHQETDEKNADAAAKAALLASARANLERLRSLENFKRVTAPFDGVVTSRRIDVGTLINSGSGQQGMELFRVADRSKLRIYVQVPQSDVAAIKVGMTADLQFAEHPGQNYQANLVRTADALDPTSRSLLVELQMDNAKSGLLPGSYAEVHLKLISTAPSLRLPVNTLLFRADGLQVAKLDARNKVALVPIAQGQDYGSEVEVLSGLDAGDDIVVNPPDSLVAGQVVRLSNTGKADRTAP